MEFLKTERERERALIFDSAEAGGGVRWDIWTVRCCCVSLYTLDRAFFPSLRPSRDSLFRGRR